ncbi:GumC family protein [Cytophaga hutchinsonii]|uniref:Possible tyrosine-protein kinase n=1 Tax=Cytophaga hutchinsonii (strain ATCC 33406 / DSM 1761 / CIP 103989 / NBRC 15051 / NCIMB 9469 / D465) TaxID=269798 RepID=A0A6N4SUP7_CYTH3|nr:GNVR domain-containing protein [Cytophaga hutchinsonii]ABG60132.1 possible tyrosine-protein kinase [Cytophaga hutchinsonii ATCC 33406]SFX23508.1 Chain length determinant protein [Cytophaga hutchinsonii ATCC 33406]
MNNLQQIIRIFQPAFKGFPIIIGIMAVMIFIASRIVRYSTPMYECTGRIKLEDPNIDISNTNLFKTFDVFNNPSKIMAEVEVVKSPEMLRAALSNIPFDVSYYREGNIRTSELFYDSPFAVRYTISNTDFYGIHFNIQVIDTTKFNLSYILNEKPYHSLQSFNKPIQLPGIDLYIKLNSDILKNKPAISIFDKYFFTINSMEQQMELLSTYVDVNELDKDIPVIRIICKHPVPEKAMLMTNTLMETYIEEGIKIKTGAAKKTVDFIDQQLVEIADKLITSENELENYRLKNNITNTKLEVETDLKKVAQLKIQLTNVEMNLATLDTIDQYINQDSEDFLSKAANYEGYGGLLYTELMKRLKELQAERKELLLKYTPENDKIKVIDANIDDVTSYIKTNIHNTKNGMRIQRDKIQADILLAEIPFESIPTKEKQLIILERNFKLNQEIYNFLTEKNTEASIAEGATFSFHRIIQRATLPSKPVSPKKTFTLLVFGFLGLIIGLAIVYIYEAISSRIKYKDELEKNSTCPVIADIRHENYKNSAKQDFLALATRLLITNNNSLLISLTSSIDKEGKTFIAQGLAHAFSDMKVPVLLIGSNLRNKSIGEFYNLSNKKGFSEYIIEDSSMNECIYNQNKSDLYVMPEGDSNLIPEAIFTNTLLSEKINLLKNNFKVIILDTPSFDTSIDALPIMRVSDINLYLFRANFTKTKQLIEPDLLKEEYALDSIRLILNDVEGFSKMKKDRGIRRTIKMASIKAILFIRKKFSKNK